MKKIPLITAAMAMAIFLMFSMAFAEQYIYKPQPGQKRSYGKNTVDIAPGVIIPNGKFGEMAEPGFGGMIFLNRQFLPEGFEAGIGSGLFHLSGKDLRDEGRAEYHSFDIVPMLLNTGLSIRFGSRFSVIPSLSLGVSYISIDYMYSDEDEDDENENTFDPTAMGGLGMRFRVNHLISLSLTGKYGVFMEEDSNMHFASGLFLIEFRL